MEELLLIAAVFIGLPWIIMHYITRWKTAATITNDDEFNSVMNKLLLMTNANVDGMRVHNETWAQQFRDAMVVNGGDIESASTMDYVMHFLTFGFKVKIEKEDIGI